MIVNKHPINSCGTHSVKSIRSTCDITPTRPKPKRDHQPRTRTSRGNVVKICLHKQWSFHDPHHAGGRKLVKSGGARNFGDEYKSFINNIFIIHDKDANNRKSETTQWGKILKQNSEGVQCTSVKKVGVLAPLAT